MAALEAAKEAGDKAEVRKQAQKLGKLLENAMDGKVGKDLSAKEIELEDERYAEATARILSSDKAFINEYAMNPNLAERFLANLEKVGGWFKRMTSKEARTAYKQVQEIKAKFLDALAERGYQYKNGKVIAAAEEKDKEKTAEAVDSEDGVRYNRDDKSLWDLLSKQDKARLYERIDSMHHLGNTEKQLPNGNYLIDIDNKIIETDASFDSLSLESIVELSVFSKKISEARDLLYEYINNGRPIWECVDLINKVCEEKVATLYQSQNSGDNSVVNGQRQNDRGTRQNGGELGNRRGNSSKNRRAISYHFNDDGSQEITYSDGTEEIRFSRAADEPSVRTKKDVADLLDIIIETDLVYDDGKYEEWKGVVKGRGKIVDRLIEGLKTAEMHFPKKKTPTERKNLCGRLDKVKRMCYNIKAFGKRRGFQNENPRKNRTASGCGAVGSALPWGGRGRTFKSCHSDQISSIFSLF